MDGLFQRARNALTHVFWLGGPGCSGKSSVARILGSELGLHVYNVDAERHNHEPDPSLILPKWREIDFSGKQGKPLMYLPSQDAASYVIDSWKAIFVQTTRHLLTLPSDQGIIVEGVFLPETLLQVADRSRIAFMVSNRTFREENFGHRHEWFAAYEDKERAYRTALEALDDMDGRWVSQANTFKVPINRLGIATGYSKCGYTAY